MRYVGRKVEYERVDAGMPNWVTLLGIAAAAASKTWTHLNELSLSLTVCRFVSQLHLRPRIPDTSDDDIIKTLPFSHIPISFINIYIYIGC